MLASTPAAKAAVKAQATSVPKKSAPTAKKIVIKASKVKSVPKSLDVIKALKAKMNAAEKKGVIDQNKHLEQAEALKGKMLPFQHEALVHTIKKGLSLKEALSFKQSILALGHARRMAKVEKNALVL